MGLHIATLNETFSIFWLNGSTWISRELSGAECLQMAINANANNNAFILMPSNISGVNAYTILSYGMTGSVFYLLDSDSGITPSGYTAILGYRNPTEGFTRPDLRGIRLASGTALTPSYSGNINASNTTFAGNNYMYFGAYSDYGLDPVIYIPPSVENIYINDSPLVTYNWISVPSVSGKNGILSLSTINQDAINDGNPVTGAEDEDVHLADQTKLETLIQNIPFGVESDAIYAGSVDKMTISRAIAVGVNPQVALKFYMGGSSTPFYTIPQHDYVNSWLGFLIDEEAQVAKPSIITKTGINPNFYTYNNESPTQYEMEQLYLWLHSHIDDDTDDPDINGEDEGTDPSKWTDVPIAGLTKPTASAINTGFTTMYMMEVGDLRTLSNFMWSNNFVDIVNKFFDDPKDIIVGLSIMPLKPDHASSKTPIQAGGIATPAEGYLITDQYKVITAGTCEVKTEKGNFMDFPPFTKITAHIPFVGEHSLDVNDVMGKRLTLKYIFDFLSGSCVAEIDVDGKPRYFFGGSTGIQIPTSAEDYGRMYSSILSAGASVGSTLATIATGGLTAPLMVGAISNQLANGMNMTPDVTYSSGDGSINGMLSYQTAFLTVELPNDKRAKNQNEFIGRPSYIKRTLSSCTGYLKCLAVHLDEIGCLESERNEIEKALLAGVRVESGSETPSYTPTTERDTGLVFLKCVSDKDVIGKSWPSENTGDTLTIEGKLLYNQDVLHPVFLIEGNVFAYNYVYIPLFGRFYYISTMVATEGSMIEVHMDVDVLQSWKSGILANDAIIERSENSANVNAYFNDGMYWTQQNKRILTAPFLNTEAGEAAFDRDNNCYILTVAGG